MTGNWLFAGFSVWLILVLGGCVAKDVTPDTGLSSPPTPPPTAVSKPGDEPPQATPTVDASTPSAGEDDLSLADMETAVKADLAALLGIPIEHIGTTEAVAVSWPDQGLGCGARKGLFQAVPVPGYRIALSYGNDAFRYHTDRRGRFVRCLESGKPIGPIIRR
jgi:hypothetical protein